MIAHYVGLQINSKLLADLYADLYLNVASSPPHTRRKHTTLANEKPYGRDASHQTGSAFLRRFQEHRLNVDPDGYRKAPAIRRAGSYS